MSPRALRLIAMVVLFIGWLGYLLYLVSTRPREEERMLILSRPQLLVSPVHVIAEVSEDSQDEGVPSSKVRILEILHSSEDDGLGVNQEVEITNLRYCRPHGQGQRGEPSLDWSKAGKYLLPLERDSRGSSKYRVTRIPDSPGFSQGTPRIYPDTSEIRAQYDLIPKLEHSS